jgi:hypothetical protein
MAINSAVKDLEHSEVDTDFFLQNEPFRPPVAVVQDQSIMGPPAPPPPLPGPPILPNTHHQQQVMITSDTSNSSSSSATTSASASSTAASIATSKSDRPPVEKQFKDAFEFEIVEQLIIEQQLQSEDKNKYKDAASSIKRYDPKFRALTEAFRQMEEGDDDDDHVDEDHVQDHEQPRIKHDPQQQQYPYPLPPKQVCVNH